jgi:hypothetical protein
MVNQACLAETSWVSKNLGQKVWNTGPPPLVMGFAPVHIRLRFAHGVSAGVYRWCHASGNMASANACHSAAINGATAANPNVAVGAIPAEAEMAAEKRVSLRSFIMVGPRSVKTFITQRNVPPRGRHNLIGGIANTLFAKSERSRSPFPVRHPTKQNGWYLRNA